MSPSNINSFVGDLVQMAKAMETLPQVEQELAESRKLHRETLDIVARIQADLEQSRNYAASLEQKVRSLEVERDDASFRVLEAEDKAVSVLRLVRSAQAALGDSVIFLDPPKPLPVKEPEASPLPVSEITDVTASNGVVSQENANSLGNIPDWMRDQAETSLLPSGQSAERPTEVASSEEQLPTATSATMENALVIGSHQNAVIDETATPAKPTHGPYFGKRYIDVEGYISRDDWLAGGGTDYDYDWRPSTAQNCAF